MLKLISNLYRNVNQYFMNLLLHEPSKQILECPTCHKEYKRKDFYRKHVVLCEMLMHGKHNEEDTQDIPNMHELYIMMQELASKYTECKKECSELKKRLSLVEKECIVSRKKTTPDEYLAEHKRCDEDFRSWINSIVVKESNVKKILDKHISDVLCDVIKEYHNFNSPLCAFKWNRKNAMHIYNKKYWEVFDATQAKYVVDTLLTYILVHISSFQLDDCEVDKIISVVTSRYSGNNYQDFMSKLFVAIEQNVE